MRVPYDDRLAGVNYSTFVPPQQEEAEGSVVGAAFRQENLVTSYLQYQSQRSFEDDPDFDFDAFAKESEAFQIKPSSFFNVQSEAEWRWMENKVQQEKQDRDLLASSGAFGMGMSLVAAIADPTTLLPGGAIFRGARGISALRSATSVGTAAVGATALAEAGLHQTQELRTAQESLFAVGGAAVLGGLLGGAASQLGRRELGDLAGRMADAPGATTIRPLDIPSPVGAQVNPDANYTGLTRVEGIAPSFGLGRVMEGLNPDMRTLQSPLASVRAMSASLSTGGVRIEGVPNIGGDVESIAKQALVPMYHALHFRNDLIGGTSLSRGMRGFSVKQFNEDTGMALRRSNQGTQSEEVSKFADFVRQNVYLPMYKEAQRVGLRNFQDLDEEYVMSYVNRQVKVGLVERDRLAFEDMIKEHLEEVLTDQWSKRIETVEARNAMGKEEAQILELGPDEARAAREQAEAKIASLPERFPEEVRVLAEEIRAMRAEARGQRTDEAKALRAEAKRLEKENADLLKPFTTEEKKLKSRFRLLGQGRVALERNQRRALRQIEEIEADADATRGRLVNSIERVIRRIDKLSDDQLYAELEKVEGQLEKHFDLMAREEERLATLENLPEGYAELEFSDVRPSERISILRERQARREARFGELLEKLNRAQENIDNRDLARGALRDVAKEAAKRSEATNLRRAKRIELLEKKAAENGPEVALRRATDLRSKAADRMQKLLERAADSNIRLKGGKADVSEQAKEIARDYTEKMLGDHTGVPGWAMLNERGPELARLLHIDETRTWSNGRRFEEFLENDIEQLMRNYLRVVGTDIELQRKFGTVNPLDKNSQVMKQIDKEYREALTEAEGIENPDKRAKEMARIAKNHSQDIKDLRVKIERIRHTRGLPPDPSSIGHRLARGALNLNTTRFMGKVLISSLVDAAFVVMKHGLLRTFRDGFLPLVTNLKAYNARSREVQQAGTALDVMLHGRAAAMFDVFDDIRHGTKLERGLQYSANNIGIVALFDFWNTAMKQFTGNITIGKIMDDLEAVATKADRRAADRLSQRGISPEIAEAMWRETSKTGARVNGIMLPNTEDWGRDLPLGAERDRVWEARRALRAAIAREVDDVIVTPGSGDRPSWMDKNDAYRLVAQFRSFTFSSTQKIILALAQDVRTGDMATIANALVGVSISLALGALSYYTWAMTTSSRTRQEMQNASLDKWADEAIARSGLLGVLSEVQRLAEDIPATSEYATLSGKRLERSPFNRPSDTILGPTASLVDEVFNKLPQGDLSAARDLAPYNNLFWLSRAFDNVEKALE